MAWENMIYESSANIGFQTLVENVVWSSSLVTGQNGIAEY